MTVSRRSVLGMLGASALATGFGTSLAKAGGAEGPQVSPDQALAMLRKGNTDYLAGSYDASLSNNARRLQIAKGQKPLAIVVGCSDSRVAPEILFGRGLGELFTIRIAGNTVDDAALGSIEYAVAELGTPLVVVLGHEKCGAVAAVDIVENNTVYPGAIGDMGEPIIPAVLGVRGKSGDLLDNAVRENVRRVVARLKISGELLEKPLQAGKLKIVGARYDLDDGKVEFIS
ncbi:carbonic anhydrase [Deinococcus frigens]|uniref:carbonic anhydrase n=1 Tax=Deinococcus frigens TaxID=249403 RepID=UPI0004955FAE|nr:carbonic anhydrase [Deinococcus frigens]